MPTLFHIFVWIFGTALCGTTSSTSPPSLCGLPPRTGGCKAEMERYHFNVTASKCKKFIYGGCQGNENNFESESYCQDACGEPLENKDARRETVKITDFESGLGDWEISNISLVDIAESTLGITPGSSEGHMAALAGNDKVKCSAHKHLIMETFF